MLRPRLQLVLLAVALCIAAAMLISGGASHPESPWTRAGYAALAVIAVVSILVKAGLKPKHLRIRFRLRTLLMAVAAISIACAYVSWQARIVRERVAALAQIKILNGSYTGDDRLQSNHKAATVPWQRKLLGDVAIYEIEMPPETKVDDRRQLWSLFPEAQIHAVKQSKFQGISFRTRFDIPDPDHDLRDQDLSGWFEHPAGSK